MLNYIFGDPSGFNTTTGLYHMLGAEPMREFVDEAGQRTHEFGFWGKRIQFKDRSRMVPHIAGDMESFGFVSKAMSGVAVGVTGLNIVEGLATGGLGEAASRMIIETQANKALLKYGYTSVKDGNVRTYSAGRFSNNPEDWKIMGRRFMPKWASGRLSRTVGAVNLADFAGRAVMGSIAGSSVAGMLGGGLIGTVGGAAAATFATKHTWKLAGVGLLAAGAYGVGYGSSQILKAGYAHRQNQRSIHTSGSMAAFGTQGAYTMRQRAVQAIHKSHLNARSALGQEASFMHAPRKNYHSTYRM